MRMPKHREMKKTSYDGQMKGIVSETIHRTMLGLVGRCQGNNAVCLFLLHFFFVGLIFGTVSFSDWSRLSETSVVVELRTVGRPPLRS